MFGLEYKKVESFEVNGILFSCVSKWNGLEEWKDAEGRKMIVSRAPSDGFAEAFSEIFGSSGVGCMVVLTASPELIPLLKDSSPQG